MPQATLLTRHQKSNWIAPALSHAHFSIVEFTDFDTDTLGTFCGSVERLQDAKETAQHKARLATELTGSRYGIGSEGSFTQNAIAGLTWEQEVICLYDSEANTSLYGMSEGPVAVVTAEVESAEDIESLVRGTAPQKWMWLDGQKNWHKALDYESVHALFYLHKTTFPQTLSPDYRAMHSPCRQAMIAKAAEDLAHRLNSKCPVCHSANFVYNHKQPGLPCHVCAMPTTQAKGWWAKCENCGFEDFSKAPDAFAEPVNCGFCNP